MTVDQRVNLISRVAGNILSASPQSEAAILDISIKEIDLSIEVATHIVDRITLQERKEK